MELVGGEERVDGENCRLLEGREGPCRVLGFGLDVRGLGFKGLGFGLGVRVRGYRVGV